MAEMTMEQMKARIAELEAEKAAKNGKSLKLKISEKKALSLYGLGRFPVTLYKSQWNSLIAEIDTIKAFLKEHDAELATKE